MLRVEDAERVQRELAARVVVPSGPAPAPRVVVGLDVSYVVGSDRVAAAAVAVDAGSGRVLEEVVVHGAVAFPYVPGLLAFREVPVLVRALDALRTPADLLLCDGQGIAHPRRCGLAAHLGWCATGPRSGARRTASSASTPSPGRGAGTAHRCATAGRWSARCCAPATGSGRCSSPPAT